MPSKKRGLERIVTPDQFTGILLHASRLQEYYSTETAIQRTVDDIFQGAEGLPLSEVYRTAQGLNIPEYLVDRVIRTFMPSPEEQRADIKKYGVIPHPRLSFVDWQHTLFSMIKDKDPLGEYRMDMVTPIQPYGFGEGYLDKIERASHKILFYSFRSSKSLCLAEITFRDGLPSVVTLFDPCVLRLCGEAFNNATIQRRYSVD